MTTVRTVCPLNCPDCCSFLVEVLENKVVVHGDRKTMGVSGFVCPKGQALGESVFAPDRIRDPLLKINGEWQKISWNQAYDLITAKISKTIEEAGSQAILHMFDNGHNGRLKNLDRRFFQALGGVTEPRGDMCWGAGFEAQIRDFGAVYASEWEEMLNSKIIILWGRDPAVTNKHLIPLLRQAAAKGTHIIVINPLKVKSTAFAQEFIRVNPGTDGVLALGIAHAIIKNSWIDFDFVKENAVNFDSYSALARQYPPERAAAITGVPLTTIEGLARILTRNGPVMFYLGYGLQRYVNGGNTVRAIDALAVISGNIGCSGGGVFYAHQYHNEKLNSVLLAEESYQTRTFPHAVLADELLKEETFPKIQLAFVTRTNPLVTEPDSEKWRQLWSTIPFKVTFERRMSETAALSDLVLPITTIFEEEDLLATSWSTMIHYAQRVIEPQENTKPEWLIFTELAAKLGLEAYFPYTCAQWLEYILEPLQKNGITLEKLRRGPVKAPYIPKVAWEDKKFRTASGKVELVTKEDYFSVEQSAVQDFFEKKVSQSDSYILLTPHPDMALNSQFQTDNCFRAYLHPQTASAHGIQQGEKILVQGEAGQLAAVACLSEDVHKQTIVIPQGAAHDLLGVNCLIPGRLSSLGESSSYYDTFCRLRKWDSD